MKYKAILHWDLALMSRNRKRQRKKKQTNIEIEGSPNVKIPAGHVPPERLQHDEIEVEARTKSLRGSALISGEYVSTLIRKLLECGAITNDEAHAANTFSYDHDMAYASCKSSLCSLAIDGGGGSDFSKQVFHAQRFNLAKAWLRPNMLRIAEAAILGTMDGQIVNYSFKSLGSHMLPKSSEQEHFPAGKSALALVIKELHCFYASIKENTKSKRKRTQGNSKDNQVASG